MKRISIFCVTGFMILGLFSSGCAQKDTTIRVATDATWPPFEYVNTQTNQIVGLDIDLFNAIAQKEGLKVDIINVQFDPLLAGLAQCQYDVAISSITITDDRKKDMNFSDPYFAAGQTITVLKGNTDITGKDSLAGKRIGAQIATTGADEARTIPGAIVKTYDEVDLAINDLLNDQLDAVIADNPLALGYVGKYPDKLKITGPILTNESYGIAVCKSNTSLLSKIDKGLAEVKAEGLIDQLTQKWLSSSGN
jgi:polar amino acid transport system substrate-binding protein